MQVTNRKTVLLVAALLVCSLVAVPSAFAAVTVDTTNDVTSSSTSDWQDGTVVTDIDNSSKESTIQVTSGNASSGSDFDVYLSVNDSDSTQDGKQIYHTGADWTAVNATAGNYEYNITHGEAFASLERDADENVTVDVEVVVNESETSEESVTFQITADNDADSAVAVLYPSDDNTETTNVSAQYAILDRTDDDLGVAEIERDVGLASNTSTVRLVSEDGNVSNRFEEATADASAGAFVPFATATIAEQRVPVFAESADAEWLDTNEDVYATINSAGNQLTIHNADQLDDDGTVTVTARGNDAVGFFTTFSLLRDYDAGITTATSVALDARDLNGDPELEEA